MIIQISLMKGKGIESVIEVSHLRKDGSFHKWVQDDILAWISKPGRTVSIEKFFPRAEDEKDRGDD